MSAALCALCLALFCALMRTSAASADEPRRRPWTHLLATARARAALLGTQPSDERERLAAVALFARIAAPANPESTLLAALDREQSPRVREALLLALARRARPESVPALVAVHRRGDAVERGLALRALAAIGTDAAVRELVAGLASADADELAVPALARAGPRAVPAVLRALREPGRAVAAAAALGALGDTRATAPLVAMLDSARETERVAALDALARLGDPRAADAVAARLHDDAPRVVLSALAALAVLGDSSHAATLRERVRTGSSEVRRAALTALIRADPPIAAVVLAAVLEGDPPELLGAARALLLEVRDPAFAALLEANFARDAQPAAVAGALAALDGGAGVASLLRLAASGTALLRRAAASALAVAVRTWWDDLDAGTIEAAHAVLEELSTSMPRSDSLVLRGLARDPRIAPTIRSALAAPPVASNETHVRSGARAAVSDVGEPQRADSPAVLRAAAALAAEALGERELAAPVLDALGREHDDEAFRRLADAARALGAGAPIAPLLARARDLETGAEALLLAATSLGAETVGAEGSGSDGVGAGGVGADDRRAFAVLARAALRAPDERLRSAAAQALSLAHDRAASAALHYATRDPSPLVAIAAARALAALPPPASLASELAADARATADEALRAALLDASDAARLQRATPLATRGTQVLHVRLRLSGATGTDGVGVDLRLDDGRFLRRRTLPGGELFVIDLAASDADLTLRTDRE